MHCTPSLHWSNEQPLPPSCPSFHPSASLFLLVFFSPSYSPLQFSLTTNPSPTFLSIPSLSLFLSFFLPVSYSLPYLLPLLRSLLSLLSTPPLVHLSLSSFSFLFTLYSMLPSPSPSFLALSLQSSPRSFSTVSLIFVHLTLYFLLPSLPHFPSPLLDFRTFVFLFFLSSSLVTQKLKPST